MIEQKGENMNPEILNVVIENVISIVGTLFITLIGVLGVWLTARLEKNTHLSNITAATKDVIRLAQQTAAELQQTVVEGMKAANKDNKLSKEEVAELGKKLLEMTIAKMSQPTYDLLAAAKVDINALITGAGEEWIKAQKAA